ncbi:hypothetical protein B0H13DRAFT_2369607 [Mycena leptocephala]|nr:hypothetical protein B0H13DRAFT_2369607 [Mycena leptocephala]
MSWKEVKMWMEIARRILLPQAPDLAGVARQTANSVLTLHDILYSWLRLSDRRRTFCGASLIARRPSAPQPAPLVRAGGARGVCASQMPPFLEYPPLPVSPLSGIAHARRQSLLSRGYRARARFTLGDREARMMFGVGGARKALQSALALLISQSMSATPEGDSYRASAFSVPNVRRTRLRRDPPQLLPYCQVLDDSGRDLGRRAVIPRRIREAVGEARSVPRPAEIPPSPASFAVPCRGSNGGSVADSHSPVTHKAHPAVLLVPDAASLFSLLVCRAGLDGDGRLIFPSLSAPAPVFMQLSSGVALVCRAEDDARSISSACFPLQRILIHLLFLAARCALPPPPLDQTQMRRVRTLGFHTAWVRAYAS